MYRRFFFPYPRFQILDSCFRGHGAPRHNPSKSLRKACGKFCRYAKSRHVALTALQMLSGAANATW